MFKSLGILVQLGLAGVGQVASEWWSWELVGRELIYSLCRLGVLIWTSQLLQASEFLRNLCIFLC
jgi:MATE family multidrug resistance protein